MPSWRDFWCAGSLTSLWKSKPGKSVCWQGVSHRLRVTATIRTKDFSPCDAYHGIHRVT